MSTLSATNYRRSNLNIKKTVDGEKANANDEFTFKVHIQDKGLASKDYLVDKKCSGCGTCLKVCPAGNITIEDGKPKFGNKCYKCYACIHNCPKNALHLKNEKSSKRWRNENVTLKDIIDANNQNRDTF